MNPLQQMLEISGPPQFAGAGYILQSDAEVVIVLVRTEDAIHEVSFFGDGEIEIPIVRGCGRGARA